MAGRLTVHTAGFRKRVAWRGPFGVLTELISNALDEKVTRCDVLFEHVERQSYRIRVEDDSPEGFRDLAESYTLYADSYKVNNAGQRGRFNYGEKVAIVLCEECRIESTTGTVEFTADDTKHFPRRKRECGTVFEGTIRCTREQFDAACNGVRSIIVPDGITLIFNGQELAARTRIASTECQLPTIAADADGNLIKTARQAQIHVYEVRPSERATIYELGIPVAETGDVFHYDVRQKVPMSVDRNTVTPNYLKRLRAAVLNVTHARLTEDQAASKGVTDGLSLAEPTAIQSVLTKRFGEQRFVPDFNREATGALTSENYTAVPTNAFDRDTFAAIKAANALPSGNQLRPKLTVAGHTLPDNKVTPAMRKFRALVAWLADAIIGKEVEWHWSDTPEASTAAQCAVLDSKTIRLTWNVGNLGVQWFDGPTASAVHLDIIFHELGHHTGAMDCTRDHCNQVTLIASKVAVLMLTRPELFAEYR